MLGQEEEEAARKFEAEQAEAQRLKDEAKLAELKAKQEAERLAKEAAAA